VNPIDWIDANIVDLLNGLSLGMLLFIVAVGLSLVFGMMDVLNLAHGALFLAGAYVGVAVLGDGEVGLAVFALALLVAAAVGVVSGAALAGLTRPLAHRGHLDQALLTLGIALVVADGLAAIFGEDVQSVPAPAGIDGRVSVLGHTYPTYRLVLIGVGLALAVLVHAVLERTALGAVVRATVADRAMVRAVGIDTRKVLLGVFVFAAVLAMVGGLLAAPVLGAQPGLDDRMLLLALVVVVVGGLGSVRGALVGALLIGQVQVLGVSLLPEYASFLLFGAMALVLLLRPAGLLPAKSGVPA
jgi:branched-chain amino acid transport system permease protein